MPTNNIYTDYDMNGCSIRNLADAAADQDAVTFKQVKAVASSMIKKAIAVIGDDVSTNFSITHNLNTQDIIVQVRATNSDYIFISPNTIKATDVNTVAISFASAPTSNQYTVIILG